MEANALILLLAKATLILGLAFAAIRLERTSPASRRHELWSATFVALLALPVLALTLPGIHVPIPSWRPDRTATADVKDLIAELPEIPTVPVSNTADAMKTSVNAVMTAVRNQKLPVALPAISTAQILFAIWLTGVVAALFALFRSVNRVRRLASSGTRLTHPAWRAAADAIGHRLGLPTTPDLVVSESVSTPMAGHIGRPVVFLPPDAHEWNAERRDVVLTHEMTHLARRDPLRILAGRVAGALYWFHPLMWIAARRASADCEQACDESVLALGVRPSTYAQVLLDFASHAPSRPFTLALPIVQKHRLETRVMSILSSKPNDCHPHASYGRSFLTTVTAAGIIMTVAAARPAAVEAVTRAEVAAPLSEVVHPMPQAPGPKPTHRTAPLFTNVTPAAAPVVAQSGSCWNAYDRTRSFNGTMTNSGGRVINRIGRIGNERIAQVTDGDVRICMMTSGFERSGRDDDSMGPSDWIGRAEMVVIETETDRDTRRLVIDGGRSAFTINGRSAASDDASAWRRAVLDYLDATWDSSQLRGQESSLRGEISSVHGERSSLLGEISSLRGEVSSMQGEISSIRGEESSMRGEISSIRGQESSLRGEISSERGAISSLESQRYDRYANQTDIDAQIRRHRDRIRRLEEEMDRYDADAKVRAVEKQIAEYDADARVAAVSRRMKDFDVERKVEAVEREIAKLNVDGQVRRIEGEITDLDVDRRVRELNTRRDTAADRLRSILGVR